MLARVTQIVMKQTKVLIADSSPFVCSLLKSYLNSVLDIEVIATATKGQQVVDLVSTLHPDVITLGLELPDMNGLQTLLALQAIRPTPVIIISGANLHSATLTLEALSYGAIDFVFKFVPGSSVSPEQLREEIISKVRLAAECKPAIMTHGSKALALEATAVAHTQMRLKKLLSGFAVNQEASCTAPEIEAPEAVPSNVSDFEIIEDDAIALSTLPPEKIIVVGASTGGPIALRQMLNALPPDFPHAILIVQHLPASFTTVLAEQLNEQVALHIKEAEDGDQLQRATAYITPGWAHLQTDEDGSVKFFEGDQINGYRPSINVTMQSVARTYGARARGILLTGTGGDGVEGMAAIRHFGGKTFAQAPETCTVEGMAQRAIETGVVDHIAAPENIARLLLMGY